MRSESWAMTPLGTTTEAAASVSKVNELETLGVEFRMTILLDFV